MNEKSIKSILIFTLLVLAHLQEVFGQVNEFYQKRDSLSAVIQSAKTDAEKISPLIELIDLHFQDSRADYSLEESTVYAASLKSLVSLGSKTKVKDIDAYQKLLEGNELAINKDYLKAQEAIKEAIAIFDRSQKNINNLLLHFRFLFNSADNQEDRLQYYTQKLNYYLVNGPVENVAPCYHAIAGYYNYKADYNQAISNYLKAAAHFKTYDEFYFRNSFAVVGGAYADWGNFKKAQQYLKKGIALSASSKDSFQLAYSYISLSILNRALNNYTLALQYADTSIIFNNNLDKNYNAIGFLEKAFCFIQLNKLEEAYQLLMDAKKISDSTQLKVYSSNGAYELDYGFFQYYKAINQFDKAGKHLLMAYDKAVQAKSNVLHLKYLEELTEFYRQQNNNALAVRYAKKYFDLNEQQEKEQAPFKIAQYENEEKELQQLEKINVLKQESAIQAATIKKNNIILWGGLSAMLLILSSLFFVYRQYHLNKKTLSSLRKTQRQLITAEKMASLGELTAGIAHEIQNPLNFINNFSEVNTELIEEMKDEIKTGNTTDALAIAEDISENSKKINQHGKRADSIVKGMLQHSRKSTGTKEVTDINALADEYFRLAYHGLRAKDKSFNANMKIDFDDSIGKINIIPQDMGRVVLNLITNAFYSVNEKKMQNLNGYSPEVKVSTKKSNGNVEITVADNGNGIPQKVLDKIFQPFFTTKPTGQGTGLGLSMSYDIIKAHGGELKVETEEGKGASFIISLPQ